MDYIFENLGDERFQELCNSIVAKEFPSSQSFPVGQPDGGRDSVVYFMDSSKKEFIVFQVKFVRNPNKIVDAHKWLASIIKEEAPKIDRLIPRGAKEFYILTNVRGTAHLDKGSVDIVNNILEEKIQIPSICWWRDDLSRKIEKDPLFKWSFPEILNGQDLLNSILFQNINENKEKRESVIKAYLADQYSMDNKVKFKQIDLDNRLFDLFTDVPIRIKKYNQKNKAIKRTLQEFEHGQRKLVNLEDNFYIEDKGNFGAAFFLLHPKIQEKIERVLLEGGPGQGKSTISQYLCQVHRARLLNKDNDIRLIPDSIKNTPIRLPFKIDLRHISTWVENKNPYKERLNEEYFQSIWKNSLESFLVGHIIYHSQIDTFNINDLLTITKISSVLFVFDGFDEIADIKIREEVIEFVNKGINRIAENSKSIQIVVTSRPAAFSDTIGFSTDLYPHFELTDITPGITQEYVERWIKASTLDEREGNEIKRLVEEKLKLPHLRELAKSPMQLAIFISLLRTRGESLPNKRTALYDSYIELFFNRESEKNIVIRNHRDLIVDIHQYLAWILHSEAELLNNSGSLYIDDLKDKLKIYLLKEGHKTDIADSLFHVMEERVCALVSRVQGTYEFEVQPLREYFCAKYLYKTSPYSPVGSEKKGTKPERFDAIARNFYWHNVVRFFAGCFDRGELPMLIQKLKELNNDLNLKNTNYPRLLTSQILSDWVFTQYPILLNDVVKIIIDGVNIGSIIDQEETRSHNEPILLPYECGRLELTEECFFQLKSFPKNDYALELIGIIKNNPLNTIDYWQRELKGLASEKLTKWLQYAYWLGIVHKIETADIVEIVNEGDLKQKQKRLQLIISGNRLEDLIQVPDCKKTIYEGILDGKILIFNRTYIGNSLYFLTSVMHPILLSNLLKKEENNNTFLEYVTNRGRFYFRDSDKKLANNFSLEDDIDNTIMQYASLIEDTLNMSVNEWRFSLQPWNNLVEGFKKVVGDFWPLNVVAVIAAGIKSKEEVYEEFDDLTDSSKSLCKRVRCARMKSGNVKYWEKQLRHNDHIQFVLLVLFTWGTAKVISQLVELISTKISQLLDHELSNLNISLSKTCDANSLTNIQYKEFESFLAKDIILLKIKFLLSHRLGAKRDAFIYKFFKKAANEEVNVDDIKLNFLIEKYLLKPNNENVLAEIKLVYSKLEPFHSRNYSYYRSSQFSEIPIDMANKIMSDSKSYPRVIASIAERSCRLNVNKNVEPVAQIAISNNWFE